MRIGIVGCGSIAVKYAQRIGETESLEIVAATDLVPGRARELVARFGGTAYESLAALLADAGVELVVNLTAPQAHASVTKAALEAGKHVHTEKPVAMRHEEARVLAEAAHAQGVRLSCAPATLLGEAQQTAWKIVRSGALGTVRAVYAEANWGRIERWHPAPQDLYAAGALVDVGVYPLTLVTAMFGPARRVHAYGTTLQCERFTRDGTAFSVTVPDFTVAILEHDTVVVRLTASFWVGGGKQRGLELHGDKSSLYLASWAESDSRLELSADGERFATVPLAREPFRGIDWSRALVDLADAIRHGRPHRASAEHATHVVEVMNAIEAASGAGGTVDIDSEFEPPAPLEWAC